MTNVNDFKSYSDVDHLKQRHGMYLGSIDPCREVRWIIEKNEGKQEAVQKEIETNAALEQCISELLTNAADHAQRCKTIKEEGNKVSQVTKIEIELKKDCISVCNNGQGIPFDIHPETNVHVPEMIFSNLRTSGNYDDTKERIVGGTNGVGAKAVNIFSTKFILDLQTGGKKYYQEFSNGMKEKTVPKITKAVTKGDYVKIVYYPDFKSFSMEDFESNDIAKVIKKKVYDLSAVTDKSVSIIYNGKDIEMKNLEDYMSLYIGSAKRVMFEVNRWEIGFALCPYNDATQISFVNAICTDGGTHVTHVLDPVLTKITNEMQSKTKDVVIKKQYIKDNIIVFIKCLIDKPTFDSQLKKKLETKISKFGSQCEIPDQIIKKIIKLGVCDNVLAMAKAKDLKDTMKKMDGTKNVRLSDIKKLDDANWAGTKKSMECTLILIEGDSAKGLASSGIVCAGGRDKWGIFPLRGKFLNVRTASSKQLTENAEIMAINRILGLKVGITDVKKLRYGKVMLLTDQDCDGHHIKGLLVNYFTLNWPELVEQGFIDSMITPIVKVFKGDKGNKLLKQFYNMNDYEKWIKENNQKVTTKYYKGLGTSTNAEAKEYFSNLSLNRIKYSFKADRDMESIERTFDKNKAEQRKDWIKEALRNEKLMDYNEKNIPINYFIDRELVQFSIYDNVRSIPNVIDGLKPSQRKILHGCLMKNLYIKKDGSGQFKVSQLSGYISEKTEYHHGEVSLQSTIIGMAQEFVGTGNMNILMPFGNYGSRVNGCAASSRYIYTTLRPSIKVLFNETDNILLKYLVEDGHRIEPEFFVPIVPMILLNGSVGIGTGWSTNIPCFKLEDIVNNIKLLLKDEESELIDMDPYYKYFKGTITKESTNKWKSFGKLKYIDESTIDITELPIGVWKEDYQDFLNKLVDNGLIKDMKVNDNDEKLSGNDVRYRVFLNEEIEEENVNTLIDFFKLEANINATNMVAFDHNREIQKYDSVEDILWTFYTYRLKFYVKRYDYLKKILQDRIHEISEKMRFMVLVMEDKIVIFKRKKADILKQMNDHGFKDIEDESSDDETTEEEAEVKSKKTKLLSIAIGGFSYEKVESLKKELESVKKEYEILCSKTHKDLWIEDLDSLIEGIPVWDKELKKLEDKDKDKR